MGNRWLGVIDGFSKVRVMRSQGATDSFRTDWFSKDYRLTVFAGLY